MNYTILVLFIFILSIEAQLNVTIPCKSNDTCKNLFNMSEISKCVNGMCFCANGTKSFQVCPHKNMIVNLKQRGLKRNCTNNEDCKHIEGATCHEDFKNSKKICDCPIDMIISMNEQKCLPVASKLLDVCTESNQCTAALNNTECVSSKCHCRVNFHFSSTKKYCIHNKVYGETCNKEEDSCFQLNSSDGTNSLECSDKNICKCLKSYDYVDELCRFSDASQAVLKNSLIIMMVSFTIKMF